MRMTVPTLTSPGSPRPCLERKDEDGGTQTHDKEGRSYYFRQLRDMKMKIDLENMTKGDWLEYVEICGWTLARAHARTGDAATIGGYLGKNDTFDSALAKFAASYADQADRDHATLVKAIRSGRLKAQETTAG
jgi:hypothetical protein